MSIIRQEHLNYLDGLRNSGAVNMYGARPYLMGCFPELDKNQAEKVLDYWMDNYDEDGTILREEGTCR